MFNFNNIFTPEKIKTIIVVAIILVGVISAGIIGYTQIFPKFKQLEELKLTAVQKSEELNKILLLRTQLDRMRIEVTKLQHEMDSLEAIFPKDPDVPGLVTNITRIARTERISTTSFKPSGNLAREYYIENYYDMTALGSYHSIGSFLAQIANFELLVNIDRVNIRVSPTLMNDLQNFERTKRPREADRLINSIQIAFRLTTYSSLQGGR